MVYICRGTFTVRAYSKCDTCVNGTKRNIDTSVLLHQINLHQLSYQLGDGGNLFNLCIPGRFKC